MGGSSLSNFDNKNSVIKENADARDSDSSSNILTQIIEKRFTSIQILNWLSHTTYVQPPPEVSGFSLK